MSLPKLIKIQCITAALSLYTFSVNVNAEGVLPHLNPLPRQSNAAQVAPPPTFANQAVNPPNSQYTPQSTPFFRAAAAAQSDQTDKDVINSIAKSSATLAEDCSISENSRPANCLKTPGWFDVSAGYVVIPNAGVNQQSAAGYLFSIRAYPFGRWSAPLKYPSQASLDAVKQKIEIAKRLNEIAGSKSQDAAHALINQKEIDKANEEVAREMKNALEEYGQTYPVALDIGGSILNRISFFYGRSFANFDTSVISGDINVFGIAYDISPKISVVWGRAYYNLPAQADMGNNTSSGNVLGVQLNLKDFSALRGIFGS